MYRPFRGSGGPEISRLRRKAIHSPLWDQLAAPHERPTDWQSRTMVCLASERAIRPRPLLEEVRSVEPSGEHGIAELERILQIRDVLAGRKKLGNRRRRGRGAVGPRGGREILRLPRRDGGYGALRRLDCCVGGACASACEP